MDRRDLLSLCRRKFPLTVLVVAGIGWYLAANGIYFEEVFGEHPSIWNPFWHLASIVFHNGWGHFRGNLTPLLVFGVAMTLLTADEHVLGLIVVPSVIGSVFYAVGGGVVVGSSGAVFAIFAGLLVRSVGDAMQNESMETLLAIELGLLAPFVLVLMFMIVAVSGHGVAHMGHFMAFCFGALYEFAFVAHGHARGERTMLSLGVLRSAAKTGRTIARGFA